VNLDPHCIFCKIIEKKVPAKIIHEDELAVAFEDLNPQAPVHILIVPRKHIADIQNSTIQDRELIGHLFYIAKTIAKSKKIDSNGYRLVINNGLGAGQTVFHIHLHLLSGRNFSWPPG
jgi:histidine triad (HIT) family protein